MLQLMLPVAIHSLLHHYTIYAVSQLQTLCQLRRIERQDEVPLLEFLQVMCNHQAHTLNNIAIKLGQLGKVGQHQVKENVSHH